MRTFLEDHFCKTSVILGKVRIAFPAIKVNVSKDGGFVTLRGETSIRVLYVFGSYCDILGDLEEVVVVSAFWAYNSLTGAG